MFCEFLLELRALVPLLNGLRGVTPAAALLTLEGMFRLE